MESVLTAFVIEKYCDFRWCLCSNCYTCIQDIAEALNKTVKRSVFLSDLEKEDMTSISLQGFFDAWFMHAALSLVLPQRKSPEQPVPGLCPLPLKWSCTPNCDERCATGKWTETGLSNSFDLWVLSLGNANITKMASEDQKSLFWNLHWIEGPVDGVLWACGIVVAPMEVELISVVRGRQSAIGNGEGILVVRLQVHHNCISWKKQKLSLAVRVLEEKYENHHCFLQLFLNVDCTVCFVVLCGPVW